MAVSTARRVMTGVGVFYLLIGVLGFIPGITVQTDVAGTGITVPGEGLLLGIFAVNAVHNVAHLLVGALAVWAGMSDRNLRSISTVLAVIFAVLVVGSFVAPIVEGVALNAPDTILHLVSALITGYIAFATDYRTVGGDADRTDTARTTV
ncbi:MAG TPA: DUF4383 domain-containing protein [Chloroflexota bacterium]|jgi:hypothetical protein|nr:DUF4383 domain-containing protein [Chloroflexota bacterium]